jgi:hypothetical protein
MLRGVFFVAAAIGSACTFGSPGTKGDTAGSIAGEDTGDDDDDGMSSAPGDDGDGGGTAGMGSGTGMATSGLPGEGSSSTMPVDPDASATDDGMSSGGVGPTTSSTGEPVDPTTDTGSTDDGGGPEPYPTCDLEGNCPAGGTCVGLYDQTGLTAAFCGEAGCGNASDCAPPSSGNATPDCVALQGGGSACALSCENGETCPGGMACIEISGPEYCGYDF